MIGISDFNVLLSMSGYPANGRQPNGKVLAFAVAGQSQADGRGELDANSERGMANTLMYSKANQFVQAYEPSGDVTNQVYAPNLPSDIVPGSPGHSAWVKFSKYIAGASGLGTVFAPCGVGSTSMWTWLPGSSASHLPYVGGRTDTTTLYGAMLLRTQQMLGYCGKSALDAVLWDQGESEEGMPSMVAPMFRQLVTEFRADFGASLPVFYAQMGNTGISQAIADELLAVSEAYRQCETTYGANASTTFNANTNRYQSAGIFTNIATVTGKNLNGTNTIAAGNINGDTNAINLVWDGTVTAGFSIGGLTNGAQYLLLLDIGASGSGTIKTTTNGAQIPGSSFYGAGSYRVYLPFTANGTTCEIYRSTSGQSGNLNIRAAVFSLAASEATSMANAHMVVTHDLPRYDVTHYDQAGVKELGRRFALAVRQYLLQDTTVDGTGPRLVSTRYLDASGASNRSYITVRFDRTIVQDATKWGFTLSNPLLFRFYSSGSEVTPTAVTPSTDQMAITFTFASPFPADPGGGVYAGTVTYGDRLGPALHTWLTGVVYGQASNLPTPVFGSQNVLA